MLETSYGPLASLLGLAGSIEGRKKLQKIVYLAKELGFPGLEEPFDYHLYGPYSESVAAEVAELVLLGGVEEKEGRTPHGNPVYVYTLTERARAFFADRIRSAGRYKPGIELLVRENSRFLELAATLRFFLKNGYTLEDATREIQKRKAEQHYNESEIFAADRFLASVAEAFVC